MPTMKVMREMMSPLWRTLNRVATMKSINLPPEDGQRKSGANDADRPLADLRAA